MSRLAHEHPDDPTQWYVPGVADSPAVKNVPIYHCEGSWQVVDGTNGETIDVADSLLDAVALVAKYYTGYVDVYVRETP